MRRLLGVDLGTRCGYAYFGVTRGIGSMMISGAVDCRIDNAHDSPSIRFERMTAGLESFFQIGVDKVYYEVVRNHYGVQAAHIYGGFLARLHKLCDDYGVAFEGLSVQEIKKMATGKGNASKEAVMRGVRLWGYDPQSEDEADAIAIVRCGFEKVG